MISFFFSFNPTLRIWNFSGWHYDLSRPQGTVFSSGAKDHAFVQARMEGRNVAERESCCVVSYKLTDNLSPTGNKVLSDRQSAVSLRHHIVISAVVLH